MPFSCGSFPFSYHLEIEGEAYGVDMLAGLQYQIYCIMM